MSSVGSVVLAGIVVESAADFQTRTGLRQMLEAARRYTLAIYAHLTPEQLQVPQWPTVNPPLWELAHIGWFQEYWCRRMRPGRAPLPSRYPHFDDWYNSSVIPHATRWTLPHPPMSGVIRQLDETLEDTLAALERVDVDQCYGFALAALHEFMHAEALLMTLQTLALPAPPHLRSRDDSDDNGAAAAPASADIAFEGGALAVGSAPNATHFVFDNEKWAHRVMVSPFAMATACVTNAQFAEFVDDGGYRIEAWWSDQGSRWLRASAAKHPAYWRNDGSAWLARRFDQWDALDKAAPVVHVNLHEAMAYCAWARRRLPTETEWEWAARAGDDRRYPWGADATLLARCTLGARLTRPAPAARADPELGSLLHLVGNVWEWTASAFLPYPGFAPDPYADYSAPWFGNHQVMRGGSLFTARALVHNRFRNFYLP
ncbi:MAG: selenoneine synthase SenA, partial [Betaproteobacteria bacterium]